MKLSNAEEQLMQHIWKLDKAFMKELIDQYDNPKPATTTIATLLKRMRDKGFIGFETFGRSRQYYPLVSKSDYSGREFKGMMKNFFSNSPKQFASFFTRSTDMSEAELKELRAIIDQEIAKKQKS